MRSCRWLGVVVVLCLLTQAPAVAGVVKEPLDVWIVACIHTQGEMWTTGKDGKILHVRGQVNREFLYDATDLELVGDLYSIVNYDLNRVNGSGGLNVSWTAFLYEVSDTDPFLGTVAGHFKEFLIDARIVGRGVGEAAGVRRKARLLSVDPADIPAALLMQLPCVPDAGIYLAVGTLEYSP